MTARRWRHLAAFVLLAWLISQTASAANQDAFAHAKELYLSAAYDEALVVLDRLQTESPRETANEVAQYRVFCLLALNRSDDAQRAIEGIVNADPFYHPSETQVPPRIRNVFQNARKALLPSLVQRSYAEAKASFEKKDPKAIAQFDHVLALLDDPDMKGVAQMSDLRTVVSGFRDLAKALAAPPAAPLAAPLPASQLASSGQLAPAVTSQSVPPIPRPVAVDPALDTRPHEPSFTPPVVISQPLPRWAPPKSVDARLGFKGSIELIIDEKGNVASAELMQSVHPLYDEELLAYARKWKYKPAMRNGAPTIYLKIVEIRLQPVR